MSHNAPGSSAVQNPSESDQLGGNPGSEGSSSPDTSQAPPAGVGQPLQGVSAVSDIVALTADQVNAYEGFDPAMHATGADGKPLAKKGGGWQLKRGRRKSDPNEPTAPRTSVITAKSGVPADDVRISNDQAAEMIVSMVTGGAQQFLGPAWAVNDKAEKQGLVQATRAYLDATGGLDLSPGMGMVFAWTPYTIKRLPDEETQSRLGKFGVWIRGLIQRKKSA